MGELFSTGSIDFKNVNRKQVSFQAESPADKRRKQLVKAIEADGGRYVAFGEGMSQCGILVAAVEEAGVQKIAYIDKDRNISTVDASTKYRKLREIPNDLSVLSYLWSRDRDFVYDSVMKQLEGKKLITPIGIKKYQERQSNEKSFKKRSDK